MNAKRFNDFPGMAVPCAEVALCRSVACIRASHVRCPIVK